MGDKEGVRGKHNERVRGKQRRDMHARNFPEPEWEGDGPGRYHFSELYEYADQQSKEAITWYLREKTGKRRWAQALRLAAILLSAIGGLVPLVLASRVVPQEVQLKGVLLQFSQFGYVALALAGTSILLDRFFGFSSAWLRYVATATTLQRVRDQFLFDWAILATPTAGGPLAPADRAKLLQRLRDFVLEVRAQVEKETNEWATEYRDKLAEMEKAARQQLEETKPGSIAVTVSNAEGPVTVEVDGVTRNVFASGYGTITPVFPGDHYVLASGTAGGQPGRAGTAVKVGPGEPAAVTLELK